MGWAGTPKITVPATGTTDDGNFTIRGDWNPKTRRVERVQIEAIGDVEITNAVLAEIAGALDEDAFVPDYYKS